MKRTFSGEQKVKRAFFFRLVPIYAEYEPSGEEREREQEAFLVIIEKSETKPE